MNISNNLTDATTASVNSAHTGLLYHDIIRQNIIRYTSPVLLVFGLVGNILILVVIRRREIGHLPPGPYLAALAMTDIVVLSASLTDLWLYAGFDIDMRITDVGYKLIVFFVFSSLFSSAWLVVAVTVDRFVSVCFPLRALKIRRKHRIVTAVSTVIVCMCVNVHFVIFLKTKSMNADYAYFIDHDFNIVFFLFASAIPFFVIVLCNIGIIVATSRSRRLRGASQIGDKRKGHPKQDDARVTTLLVTLNLFYIVTTGPIAIYLIYDGYVSELTEPLEIARHKIILAILNMWTYVNNAFNFVLYCVTGKRFRFALLSLFRWRQAGDDASRSALSTDTTLQCS